MSMISEQRLRIFREGVSASDKHPNVVAEARFRIPAGEIAADRVFSARFTIWQLLARCEHSMERAV
ncbi:hypothetical protein [Bradyrhizobium sp. JYMT SZCCT0180]|uniref:hypothetical protein n=1 Tax=Bradyrhizobium sp. JYMT SZCCT0180 TaxID=2807666 RepID=UPI001BAB78EE|nr:hypothetical protein [Bradyrhizobium sp. JYMT SZCCT0180]MBR1213957.1 hypothetical protein [Bradyrhizobium sp. JYMT SZCCT0180]